MNELSSFIANSFLSSLIQNSEITDISYNGDSIFYMDNFYGRQKFISNTTGQNVLDFLRQISNLSDTPFSIKNPIMDVSFENYRLNATYYTVSKKQKENCVTFSLRIGNNKIKINKESGFFKQNIEDWLRFFISARMSFLIAGLPSCGKTEFQKYLINLMHDNERVVVIDTIDELDVQYNSNADITMLINSENYVSTDDLIKLSLRYNPDYLVLAEARGSEFEKIITSSLSGVSTITTIHTNSVDKIVDRATNLVSINNKNLENETIKNSILDNFNVLIYVEKIFNENKIMRRIKDIKLIYKREILDFYHCDNGESKIYQLPSDFLVEYKINEDSKGNLKIL